MAVTNDNKNRRIARWERKQKHNAREQRIREVLKDRKRQQRARRGVEQILRHAPSKRTSRKYREAVERLWYAARLGGFLKQKDPSRPGYVQPNNPYLFAFAQLADRHECWLRDPVDFRPGSQDTREQFSALTRHLFARYYPPAFLEQSWFERDPRQARAYQSWYLQLALGESPRRLAGLPIDLTNRAGHLLNLVPPQYTIEQGLRWVQLRAMGASIGLANMLLATRIGLDFSHDSFWLTVVRFLIDQPALELLQVGPIVDYIYYMRFQPRWRYDEDGNASQQPIQPDFSMKGRTLHRLLQQVERWHRDLASLDPEEAYEQWGPSGVPGKQWVDGLGQAQKRLVVRELLNSGELISESAAMHHCVGTYAKWCKEGTSAIFTLVCIQGVTTRSLLTIEVDPEERTIDQVRGKCNVPATDEERRFVRHWAAFAKLCVSDGAWTE
ncbi:MAG: PcfJ domain-containing protein [Planctomycetota bacterium]